VIKAVLFFNPAVLWLSRAVTLQREIACDDHVLAGMQVRAPYALFLVEFAGQVQSRDWAAAPAAWSSRSQLKKRIDMILDAKRNSSPRLARTRAGILATAAILIAAFGLYAGPRVVLAQQENTTDPNPAANEPAKEQPTATPSISVEEPAGGVATITVNPEPRPRKKARVATASVPAQPADELPLPPPAPRIARAGVIAQAPMIAPVPSVFAQAGGPDEPPPARPGRIRRDETIERRLDRLEKMVESLLQQEKGKTRMDFDYRFDLKGGPRPQPFADGDWKPGKLNDEDKARIKEQAKRDGDRAIEQAKQDVERAKEHASRDAERAIRDMQKAMRDAQRDGNLEQLDKLKEQLAQGADSMRFSLDAQRKALESAKSSLERQLQNLEKQMARLEQERGRMEEMHGKKEQAEKMRDEDRAKIEAKREKDRNKQERAKRRAKEDSDNDDKGDGAKPEPEPKP